MIRFVEDGEVVSMVEGESKDVRDAVMQSVAKDVGEYIAIYFSVPKRKGLMAWPASFVSWCIRKMTKSRVSHCSVAFFDETLDRIMVLEATKDGFRVVTDDAFEEKNHVLYSVQPYHSLKDGLRAAVRWLGTHYDYAGLLGMSVVLLGRALKRRWRNPFRSSRQQFCSEAVVRVLQASKYPRSETLSPDDCDPQKLLSFLIDARQD